MIQKVTTRDDFDLLSKLLNDSFATIAKDFGLTIKNCPTNNAFITSTNLKSQLSNNKEFYFYETNKSIVGFISIEKSKHNPKTFYIEKVAVHPDFRHKGIGKHLMCFAENRIKKLNGYQISIGLINSNSQLKEWYSKQGYHEIEIKSFEHLPFDVCVMKKQLMKLNKLNIREAQESDFEQIHALITEFAGFQNLPEKVINSVMQMKAEKDFFKCFIAENIDNEIIGYTVFFPCYFTWTGKSLYMDDIYIKHDYRSQGIGTKLINKVIDYAKTSGCKRLHWQVSNWNKPAISIYRKFGAEINDIELNCDLYISDN